MRHLFIINPVVSKIKGNIDSFLDEIKNFFQNYPQIDYDIHITRWSRDAVGYTRRYVLNAKDLVRIYAVGGTGTLFEVANGVIGLPNVQVAHYPLGCGNSLVRYFGADKVHLFLSLRNLVFGGVISIDAMRGGNNYGVSHGTIGFESVADIQGVDMLEKTGLPADFCHIATAIFQVVKKGQLSQSYKVNLDGRNLDGDYFSMMIANGPCYGQNLYPAVDAHPNDGILDVYLMKNVTRSGLIHTVNSYMYGNYQRLPDCVNHHTGRVLSISSNTVMCICLDGELFYDTRFDYEVIPKALDFVCPNGINIHKLPRIYNKMETIPEREVGL